MTMGPLPAGTLGAAAFGILFAAAGLCGPPPEHLQHEIVVTGARHSDAEMTSQVMTALQQDPYIFSDHVTVTTENGVVRVGGLVHDLSDLFAILKLAHQIAGNARVVNEIEFVPEDDDGN